MDQQKQNENNPNNIKLVFDVMPKDSASVTETLSATAAIKGAAPKPTSMPTRSAYQSPPPKTAGADFAAPRSKMWLWVIIAVAVIAVLGGGYFAYVRFFAAKPAEKQETVQPVAKLPTAWLEKNFGSNLCTDDAICGYSADPDNDGLKNFEELAANTNPNNADTDYDGLADGDEKNIYTTDPTVADTDGDKFEDGAEIRNGYSALVPTDKLSNLEKQLIDENTTKFGLHEPTKTFMTLKAYKTNFQIGATAQQISLSIPGDWIPQAPTDFSQDLSGKKETVYIMNFASANLKMWPMSIMTNFDPDPNKTDAILRDIVKNMQALSATTATSSAQVAAEDRKVAGVTFHIVGSSVEIPANDPSGLSSGGSKAISFAAKNQVFVVGLTREVAISEQTKNLENTIINSIRLISPAN